MTITVTTTSSGPYIATADTTFAVTFQSAGPDQVEVTLDDVVVDPGDYIFERDDDGTGEVVFLSPVTGEVSIYSEPSFQQTTEFQRFGSFFPDMVNSPLDKAAAKDLWLKAIAERALKVPRGEAGHTLPTVDERAGMFAAWDANGAPIPSEGMGSDSDLRVDLASQFGAQMVGKREGGSVQDAVDDLAAKAAKTTLIVAGTGLTGGGPLTTNVTLDADIADDAEAEAGVLTTKVLSPASGKALVDAETASLKLAIANGTVAALVTTTATTQAVLFGNLVPGDGQWAIVYDDPAPEKNGFYRKSGATTVGSWAGPLLADAFEALVQTLVDDAEAARDEAIAQNAGGQVGDIKYKASDTEGDVDWLSRPALAEQPVAAVDFTLTAGNPDGGQFARTTGTATVYAADGDNLRITSPGADFTWSGILLPFTAAPNRVLEVTFEVVAIDANAGIGVGFTSTAPTVGGPAVLNLPADFGGLQWRLAGTGVRQVYGPDGLSPPSTLVLSDQGNGGIDNADFGAGVGDTAGFRVEFDSTGTTARVLHLVNGRILRGVSDGFTLLSGIPSNAYIWVGLHGGNVAADDVVIAGPAAVYTGSAALPRLIYADASIGITGTGSQNNPLLAPDEVARFIALDRTRRQFRIRLRGGTYDKPLIIPDTTYIDELIIEAPQGEKAIIQPADLLEGDGLWTAVAGQANLWRRPVVFGGGTSFERGNGSIIEVPGTAFPSLTQTVGRNGFTHSYPWYLYHRLANDYNLTTLNGSDHAGRFSVHLTGTHAGYLVVHARGSADPNDLAFRRPLESHGVAVLCRDPDDWNMTRVEIDGIETRYTYSDGFLFERCRVTHGPLVARASAVSHGFQYDECIVRGFGAKAEGTGGDGYNMRGSFGNLPVDIEPWVGLWNCSALGSPTTSFSGDGFSNHEHQKVFLDDFYAIGMSKDGLSAGGDFTVQNSRILGCSDSGIKLYGVAGVTNRGVVRNTHIAGCLYGLANVQNIAGGSGYIEAYDMLYESIDNYPVYALLSSGVVSDIDLHGRQQYGGTAALGYYNGAGITFHSTSDMPAV